MTSDDELISVVIPTYNSAEYLPETLDSIVAQQDPNLEVLVVDDGSTDSTANVVSRYVQHGFKFIPIPHSGGPSRPRNVGIESAVGKLILLFDSDDIMLPGKLCRTREFWRQNPGVGLFITDFIESYEHADSSDSFLQRYNNFQKLKEGIKDGDNLVIPSAQAYDALLKENFVGTSSVAIPKAVFEKLGVFDRDLRYSEDRDLWFRIAQKYDLGFVGINGHKYRIREGGNSKRSELLNAPYRIKVLEDQLKFISNEEQERVVMKWIAENYGYLGYAYRMRGDGRMACESYVQAWKARPSKAAVRGYLASLMTRMGWKRGDS